MLVGLTDNAGKDAGFERKLAELNGLLSPIADLLEQAAPAVPRKPITFVLGPPRSGTTLVSQLLSRTGQFTTISNIAAKFFSAPALGVLVSNILLQDKWTSNYASTRGRTDGWQEPAEFGYFWSRFFDLGQSTHVLGPQELARFEGAKLQRAISSIEVAGGGRPTMFKNNTWFSFHIDLLAALFPGSVFVRCRRDTFFVAQSIWLQRVDLHGSPDRWWSIRPPDFECIRNLDPVAQVAVQAVSIEESIDRSVDRAGDIDIVEIPYERLIGQPREVANRILRAGGSEDVNTDALPARFESHDVIRMDATLAERLARCVEEEGKRRNVKTRLP